MRSWVALHFHIQGQVEGLPGGCQKDLHDRAPPTLLICTPTTSSIPPICTRTHFQFRKVGGEGYFLLLFTALPSSHLSHLVQMSLSLAFSPPFPVRSVHLFQVSPSTSYCLSGREWRKEPSLPLHQSTEVDSVPILPAGPGSAGESVDGKVRSSRRHLGHGPAGARVCAMAAPQTHRGGLGPRAQLWRKERPDRLCTTL